MIDDNRLRTGDRTRWRAMFDQANADGPEALRLLRLAHKIGAGEGNRTLVFSLEVRRFCKFFQ
jgi:hypothetical protein